MFIALLVVTFIVATATSFVVARAFHRPVALILARIVADELSVAWQRYVVFAIYLVGINGGVRIWELERYVTPAGKGSETLVLSGDRWALEIYRTLIGTLQGIAWALLLFFGVALVAYLVVRGRELRSGRGDVQSRAA
jgi:hypothetical protein